MAAKMVNGNGIEEKVILTPVAKGEDWTILQLDRKRIEPQSLDHGAHVAGGAHKGLVVNRQLSNVADYGDPIPAQVQLDFNVFLVDHQSGKHSMENRLLKFWFKPEVDPEQQMWLAAEYFKELVNPETFPRDYVGFITRLMKLMQKTYTSMSCLKIHLKQLPPPSVPPKPPIWRAEAENNKIEILTESSLLEMIERAFPNGLAFRDIAKCTLSNESDITELLLILARKGLIKQLDNNLWIRWSAPNEDDTLKPEAQTTFTITKHMPTLQPWEQPTIAVITALFCEKLAVDAMMDNKETFVRYQTQGEGTVYTLGNIGAHRVVCTKLPAVGHDRAAMIAAGNTTTRLLGIFQRVEYVFVVGCGGAVPHYTSYQRHVRLGDIVASSPSTGENAKHPYIYVFCDEAKKDPKAGTVTYATKSWRPPQEDLQMLALQLQQVSQADQSFHPWKEFMQEGMERLANQEMSFDRPPEETDKLYMAIGESDVIQVSHPAAPVAAKGTSVDDDEEEVDEPSEKVKLPRIHLGPIGGGRAVVKDQTLRQDFATHYGCLGFDYEFDPVLESIFGNRKDHYMCIRGMSDYRDGMRNKEWQPYSALAAAAFMKSVIMTMQVEHPKPPSPPPAYSYSPQQAPRHPIYAPPVQVLPTSASPLQMSRRNFPVEEIYARPFANHSNGHARVPPVVSPPHPQQARQSFV